MDVRILELSVSLPLLIISLVLLGFLLYRFVGSKMVRLFIPSMLATYGVVFSLLQITTFGKGYAAIPYVILSWLFGAILIIAIFVAMKRILEIRPN